MTRKDLEFMGSVTAGMTHEINNVLAVIRESSGLLEDLVSLAGEGDIPHRDKFVRNLSGIGRQVERGVRLTNTLNRLAHSVDHPEESVGSGDLMELAEALTRRNASRAHVEIVANGDGSGFSVVVDPFRALERVCRCVVEMVAHCREGSTVTMRAHAPDKAVLILTDPDSLRETPQSPACEPCAGVSVDLWAGEGRTGFVVRLGTGG
ncbi:MAG: hypothetical protein ACLFOY_12735 [Desulfatibacillaceae bacterium]